MTPELWHLLGTALGGAAVVIGIIAADIVSRRETKVGERDR